MAGGGAGPELEVPSSSFPRVRVLYVRDADGCRTILVNRLPPTPSSASPRSPTSGAPLNRPARKARTGPLPSHRVGPHNFIRRLQLLGPPCRRLRALPIAQVSQSGVGAAGEPDL